MSLAAESQTLEVQPTPFTALLDFSIMRHPASKALAQRGLPIWLEKVQVSHSEPSELSARTTFRIRLRAMPGLNDSLLLRVFFHDKPDARPVVTAWSETGTEKFAFPPLGAGLDLPASESLVIPTEGVDYLEIVVAGDGSSVRQALLTTLRKNEVSTAFDFADAQPVTDPFDAPLSSASPMATVEKDTFLFGRVKAMLEPGVVKLSPASFDSPAAHTVHFGFDLQAEPLLALVTFDILNGDPSAPLLAWANGEPIGAAAGQFPDLADPGYQGIARPLQKMRFHYAGWVRCQKIIPAEALRIGENTLTLQLPANAGPVAIRAVELQLKNHWRKLDYSLSP